MPPNSLITTTAAPELLGIHLVAPKRYIKSGVSPRLKLGSKRLISQQWVEEMLEMALTMV